MRIPALPPALQWDHNAHYHRWLLRQVPAGATRALDVGCGAGLLAVRLAAAGLAVDAVDASPAMIARAAGRSEPFAAAVRWLHGDVLDPALGLAAGGYDVVSAVAVLHHLPLSPGLDRLAALVAPGGVLAVVGLYRPATAADRAAGLAALPANAVVGALRAASGRGGKPEDVGMPTTDPVHTLDQVRAAARVLPGARVRRRLFWRCTLVWTRPGHRANGS